MDEHRTARVLKNSVSVLAMLAAGQSATAAASHAAASTPATRSAVSITSFGAVGDGTTNNRAAIQKALDYAAATQRPVYIPPATFAYSGTLTDNGVTLYGGGKFSILKAQTGANESLVVTGNGASVHDFQIDGTGSTRLTTNQSSVILVSGATNYTIQNILINGRPASASSTITARMGMF